MLLSLARSTRTSWARETAVFIKAAVQSSAQWHPWCCSTRQRSGRSEGLLVCSVSLLLLDALRVQAPQLCVRPGAGYFVTVNHQREPSVFAFYSLLFLLLQSASLFLFCRELLLFLAGNALHAQSWKDGIASEMWPKSWQALVFTRLQQKRQRKSASRSNRLKRFPVWSTPWMTSYLRAVSWPRGRFW